MRTVIILEYDLSTSDELEAVVRELRHELSDQPKPLGIRVANGDMADRVIETFAVEGQPKRKP